MIEDLRDWIIDWWLGIEYRVAMVDAHLANLRGNHAEAADYKCRAYDAQRQLQIRRLNRYYREPR